MAVAVNLRCLCCVLYDPATSELQHAGGSQQQSARTSGAAPLANGSADGLSGLGHLTDDGGSDASQDQPLQQAHVKKKKPKAPKAKKPTPASCAANLRLGAVSDVSTAQSYLLHVT